MDKGWEWQARKALDKESTGGEVLVEYTERWDNEEWQRWTPESNSFSSPPIPLDSFHGLSSNSQPVCATELSLFDVISGLEALWILALGVFIGDFNLSSLEDGDTEVICWSNAFRYKERRYCSKYTTSNSNTAISLINSVAGWSHWKVALNYSMKMKMQLLSKRKTKTRGCN